jgi:fructokinase
MRRVARGGGGTLTYAGVELGGTKCVCTLAGSHEDVIHQTTVPTTVPEETLGAIKQVLGRWRHEHGVNVLGIASFGSVDLDRLWPTYGFITTTTMPHWARTDVAGRLQRALNAPMAFDTDVNGAALGPGLGGMAGPLGSIAPAMEAGKVA